MQWIEPEKRNIELEIDSNDHWQDITKTPRYHAWRGYAFESACYKHIGKIKTALGIQGPTNIGAWRFIPKENDKGTGAQVDLVFDRKDDAVTLCEIKYSDKPFVVNKEYAGTLRRKMEVYRRVTRTKKQIFIAMISVNGVKKNNYSSDLLSRVVTLDDLMR